MICDNFALLFKHTKPLLITTQSNVTKGKHSGKTLESFNRCLARNWVGGQIKNRIQTFFYFVAIVNRGRA